MDKVEKKCTKCKVNAVSKAHGSWCHSCLNELSRNYVQRNGELVRCKRKEYNLKNQDERRLYSKKYRQEHLLSLREKQQKYASSKRKTKSYLASWREAYWKLKEVALAHYSGEHLECSCCGETGIRFLTLDHIDGGGRQHRKEIGRAGSTFYRWVIKNNFPSGLQVLCLNCNFAKRDAANCPHVLEVEPCWDDVISYEPLHV